MLVSAFAAWKRRLAGTEKQRPRASVRRKSRPAARGGAAVERLEDRALLAAVGADNLLVITDTASAPFVIAEYTRAGQFVQSFASQRPGGWPSGEVARDVAVTADGKIHVFNGSAAPYLSTLDPVTETWTHTPFPGWSSDGAPGAGGLGVIGNYVFASDSFTSDNSAGIVRFDTVTREAVRFGAVGIRDLSVGLDGLIYTLDAVDSRVVRAWDPETMAQVKQVTLSFTDIRGIATDAAGNLYAAQWDGTVVKIGAGGTTAVDRLLVGANLTDIEIASDGTVIVGAYDGDIHVTDAATLSTPLRIPHGGTTAYVAFSSPQFTSPPPAGISGAAFADANGNGLRDASERGLSGVTVYLDLDRDGALDPGEPTQVTGADGSYLFGVEPGEYVVRQVVHPGYEQTGPADFYYATSRGSSNLSAELLKIDAATGTVTSVGLTGNVVLHGLVRTNDGRLFGINGFNNGNDLFYSVDPTTGRATLIGSVGADLAWGLAYDAATDTIYGIGNVANSGYNRLGTFDRATGAFTPIPGGNGLSVNSLNGTAGIAFEPTRREFVVYEFGDGQTWRFTLDGTAWQLPQNTPNLGLNLAFDGSRFVMKRSFNGADFDLITLDPYAGTWAKIGTVSNGFIAESLEFVNADGFSQVVSVGAGVTAAGPEFGNRALANEIRGTVWDDLNFNGVRDPGEPGLGGVTVYLDIDGNGAYGDGFPVTTTVDPDAFPNLTVLENAVPGVTLTALNPQGAILDTVKSLAFGTSGATTQVFGHREEWGGEAILWGAGWATLRADFAKPADSVAVDVRGYFATRTAIVQAFDAAGNQLSDVRLEVDGSQTQRITVSGPGIAYVLVTSADGSILIDKLLFDTPVPEPITVSAADGSYSFTGLEPGTYQVNTIRPRGWARSSYGNDRDVYWGLAYVPNQNGVLKLVTVDPYTGQITWIGDPLPIRLYGLVRTNSGELFGTNDGSDSLYAVDPETGRVTLVGSTGWQIASSLAYDPLSDELYTVGRETTNNGTFVRLLRLDRATGQATPIGPGIQTFPGSTQGPTNLYALTYDPASQRLIALDYADGEVYAWDREGNGTLLTTSPNVRTWALSGGLSWGSFVVQPHGTGNGYLAGFDPATGMLLQPTLTLSEAAAFESLERNYDAFRYVVRVDGVISDVDFGMYDANWSPSAHAGGPYAIAEGQSLTLDGSRSSDEDDDPLTYEWDLKGDGTVDATGVNPTLTWQQLLAAGVTGEGVYTLRLRARDPGGSSSITTTTLTVTNAAPVAAADAYETDYGTTLTVAAAAGVLANDSDAGGDPLTAVLVSGPARGTLTLNAGGSFTYTPNAAFVGTDTFTYAASDGTDQSGPTTVTITVGGPASAVVDLLADEDDGNYAAGDLSLREAAKIVDAGGTITFASALAGGTITLTLGQIALDRDVTIIGLGASQLTISGNSASRHFFVAAGATVGLSGVTLTGGRVFPSGILGMGGAIDNRGALTLTDAVVTGNAADDFGGAIENFGTLTVVGCAFTNNSAGNTGGAIHNRGTLNVSRSTFTGNSATWGGAIRNDTYNNGGGFLTVADSTIADNTASWGGGIYATNQTTTLVGVVISGNSASEAAGGIDSGGTLTLVNVTISGNSTGGDGGGLRAGGSTTLRNVTIFGNRAGLKGDPSYSGGGIRKEGGTLTLHNTLIAGNLLGTGAGTANDVRGWGNAATGTNNFIADAASTAVPTNGVNGNIVGADWTTVVDPTLRDNGGPTLTHALLRGGRAVNAGNDAQALDPQGTPLATDQRGTGFPRFVGTVDIGAFELPNKPPIADDVAGTIDEDGTFEAQLPATDPDGDTLRFTLGAGPQNGRAVVQADGRVTYLPDADFFGTDSFTYDVTDGTATATATVTVTVNPVNDPARAGNLPFTMQEDTVLNGRLLASDIEGDPITFTVETGPSHGRLTLNPDGTFTYTPDPDFSGRYVYDEVWKLYGSDSFTYRATDDKGAFTTGTVVIDITPVDDVPTASDDALSVAEDGTLTLSVTPLSRLVTRSEPTDWVGLGLSFDLSEEDATFLNITYAAFGVFNKHTPEQFILAFSPPTGTPIVPGAYPNARESADATHPGLDVSYEDRSHDRLVGEFFIYDIVWNADGTDIVSFAATFEQRGLNADGTPAPAALIGSLQFNTTIGAKGGVLANDGDADGDFVTAVLVSGPAHGTLTLNADGSLVYRPDADFHGVDSFTYRVTDGVLTSDIATVTITVDPVNDAPAATSESYETRQGEPLTVPAAVGVLANDTDVDGDPLTSVLVTGPSHGTLTLNADGSFTYTPAAGYSGLDSFTYRASDGSADSGPVSVTLNVVRPAAALRLDFGTSASPLAGGHARVTEATKYSSALGYGWLSGTVASRDRGTADPLTRDFNFAADATFAVDLPNGTYNVTLTLGDATHAHDQQGVYLEGALADSVTTAKGQFVTRTFTVTVSDGQLTLRLDDLGGADPNAVICGLEVVSDGPAPPVIALSSSPASVPEDAGADLVYTFSRTGDLSAALTVSFTVGGAAAYGTDYAVTGAVSYSGTAGTVTFAAGAATAVVRVRPTADATAEPDEAVLLTLVEAAGYDVGSGASASGTITDDDPPAAPAGLTATAVSSSQIDLTWSAVAETDGYKVERSGDGGATWAQVGTTSATSYAATGLSAGTAYAFRVRAYNAAGEGPYSASASATTPDAPSFTPVRLDFGTSASPLSGGYARVTEATKYSSALGYGWLSGTVASRDRGTADPLTRDFNFAADATFAVDLPNGTYNVTLTLGDATHAHDQQGVYLEGALADSVTTAKGQFVTRTFTVTVSDGQLTLRLDDLGGADPNAVINALEVEAAGTSAAAAASEIPVKTATLAAAPIGSSRQPRLNQATAIRHRQPKSRHSAWSCPVALADPAPAERPALRDLPATRWRPAAADAALENLFADGLAEALLVG